MKKIKVNDFNNDILPALVLKSKIRFSEYIIDYLFGDGKIGFIRGDELLSFSNSILENLSDFTIKLDGDRNELDEILESFTDKQRENYFSILNYCRKKKLFNESEEND